MTILRLANTPRDYAWGSLELIPQLLGTEPDGNPKAEIWFGTHPASPAQVVDQAGGTLAERVGELGFLVKLLAAAKPLSIQAHPTKEHAAKQFAAGHPGYADGNHKPELIAAITAFRALCGFRPVSDITADLNLLAAADAEFSGWLTALAAEGLAGATAWALKANPDLSGKLNVVAQVLSSERQQLIASIYEQSGADVGVLVSLLMNYVELRPGDALFLPAGNIHAYLSGLGVEVMAASDNVLRGGLTQKPIDIPELLDVLDFSELSEPRVQTRELVAGLVEYRTPVEDFNVYRVEPSGSNLLVDLRLNGKAILVCTAGKIAISTSLDEVVELARGEAAFFDAANYFSILGSGTGYLALG